MIAADIPGQFWYNGARQNSQRTADGQNGFHLLVISTNMSLLNVYPFLTNTDEVPNLIIWTAAEISSLIMAASVPFIRLFVKGKLATPRSHGSGAQGLNEQQQEKSTASSIPTTVGSSRPGWRAQSGDSDLLTDSRPETTVNDGTLGP